MRCMSCGANIPPEWVMAIQSNQCPGCGNEIMDEKTQELLKELSEAMDKMPNDPQGVAGWLISNYRFMKMGSGEPVEKFHRKGSGAGDVDTGNLKVDPSFDKFMKNSDGAQIASRSAELAERFKGAKGGFAEMGAMIAEAGDPYGDTTTSDIDVSSSGPNDDDTNFMQQLHAQGINPFAASEGAAIAAAGAGSGDLYQAIDPGEVTNLMKDPDAPSKVEKELAMSSDGQKHLQREQFKKLKAQDAVSGGGGGAFRR